MSKKITVLGCGNVGATVAYTLTQNSLASEIVLIDIVPDRLELVEGHSVLTDFEHGADNAAHHAIQKSICLNFNLYEVSRLVTAYLLNINPRVRSTGISPMKCREMMGA